MPYKRVNFTMEENLLKEAKAAAKYAHRTSFSGYLSKLVVEDIAKRPPMSPGAANASVSAEAATLLRELSAQMKALQSGPAKKAKSKTRSHK